MKGRHIPTLLAALLLTVGCSDDSEVFYSISYPVVRIDAAVTLPEPEPEPNPEEPSTGEDSGTDTSEGGTTEGGTTEGDATEGGATEEPEPVDPLVAQIQAEVAAEALVQPGGGYTLDFTRYNRGPLTVDTATENGTVDGVFFKEPGATQINLFFLGQTYACTLSSYTDTDGKNKVLLTVDLTALYQERYPSANIQKVQRLEYTSTPTN
ncbi:hypothetical protein [Alistipes sp.]|uniref:hypothetical protein n=1 Tax=Alistipes sp. TaxID=1872444 RepID=UPI003A849067